MDIEKVKTVTKTIEKWQPNRFRRVRSATITLSRVKCTREHKSSTSGQEGSCVKQSGRELNRVTSEVENLKTCFRLAMKERLWLERQLSFLSQGLQPNSEVDVGKYVQLTKTNQTLVEQLDYLTSLLEQQHHVDNELNEREKECQALENQLMKKAQLCDRLAIELEKALEKNLELTALSSEAQQQLQRLQQQVKDVEEERKHLEKEHDEVRTQLRQRQEEVKNLRWSKETDRTKNSETVEVLQSKLRELEKKCELQNVRHEELILEMDTLRRTQARKDETKTTVANGFDPLEKHHNSSSNTYSQNTPLPSSSSSVRDVPFTTHNSSAPSSSGTAMTASARMTTTTLTTPTGMGAEATASTSSATASSIHDRSGSTPPRSTTPTVSEIERIMAKLEQDNRILAELDRTRASIGLQGTTGLTTAPISKSIGVAETGYLGALGSHSTTTASIGLGSVVATTATTTTITTGSGSLGTSLTTASLHPHNSPGGVSLFGIAGHLPTIITTLADHDVTRGSDGPGVQLHNSDDPNGFLDIPGMGRVQVHVARYSYDPLQHSPNENPEAELAVNAGDYVLVRGDMDEDGFFDGQLLDGRRGLVPSNFVEKLTGEDLLEFQQNVFYDISDESMTSLPADFSLESNIDDSQMLIESCLPGDVLCLSNLDNIEETDELLPENNGDGADIFFSALVPPPQNLTLERQFHKSILINWTVPNAAPTGSLECFNVYVDGELRVTVTANERPRALVEGVDSLRPHRLSVRSVTPNRRMSVDASCTMIIGKGVPVAPSCVRASNITSTSAIISWLPSNSNYQHVVCVNSVEVRMLKPGVYRHTITGLSPNTTYRVTVKVKNIKTPFVDEKSVGRLATSSTSVDFRTLPKGLPDPPLDVQVEPGPQDGTLLVTWLPVTINTMGTSNGSQVTGYAVYADGRKVFDTDSPTGDHALLELGKVFATAPKHVTVRTKSGDSVSPDSVQVPIPSVVAQRMKAKKKVPEEEYQEEEEESSDRSELSDIAEEAEEDMSDGQQVRGKDWKKGDTAKVDRGSGKTTADSVKRRKDVESSASSKQGVSSRSHGDRRSTQRRHDNLGQTVIEPDENLSDKEIYPSTHVSIPAIGKSQQRSSRSINTGASPGGAGSNLSVSKEITKDSASEGRGDYSDDDYTHQAHRRDPRGPGGGGGGGGRDVRDRDKMRQMGRDVGPYREAGEGGRGGGMGGPGGGGGGRKPMREGGPPHRDHHGHHPPPQHPHHHGGHPPPRNMRTFVALFDYDPKTMSPNPGAAMEELPFREGQLIKIFGDKDPDGFYWGEAAGRQGYVPCNMVSQVQGEEDTIPPGRRAVPPPRRSEMSHRGYPPGKYGGGRDRWADVYEGAPVKKMVALYDYDPQELSPNVDAEVELSFNTGDVIYVYGDMDEDGFFMGEMNNVRGLVPSNFLTEAPADYQEEPRRHMHAANHIGPSSSKGYDSHGMDRRPAHPADSGNKYNHTRSGGQRW